MTILRLHSATVKPQPAKAAAMTLRLRAEGWCSGVPSHIDKAVALIDGMTCTRMRCPGCGRRGMAYKPYFRKAKGLEYRALAVCEACQCAEEI